MWRHLNGRIIVAFVTLLAYIFDGLVQADTVPVNLTKCDVTDFIYIHVSDLNKKGYVLLSYGSDIELSLHSRCPSNYCSINNSAFELVLNRNLTTYCNPSIECLLNCRKVRATSEKSMSWKMSSLGSSVTLHLLVQIIRNASYQMDFQQTSYKASVRELTSETAIISSFKDQLIMRECQDGSLLSSPTFHIATSTKEGWFTTKDILTAGIIYSTSKVDYEQLNGTTNVNLTIRAEQTLENGVTKLTANTTLIITIHDVDDMNPVFTEDVYHLNISETKLGLNGYLYKTSPPIYAYDGDRGLNEPILYSIKDDMKSKFSINNMSGEISVLQELDADGGQDRYVIIIQATQEDNPFRSATSTLSLSVIDIDDNPPVFDSSNYNCSIAEHSGVGQVICRVNATDKDKGQNGQFSYELTNGNAVYIDSMSGYIHVKDPQMLDREKESHLYLKVIAKSSDGNMTDEANITINLIDINDNSPVFNQSSYNFIVQNISIGDYVGKIIAFDLDSGDNQKLNYSWGMCLSNIGDCSGDSMKCHFPFLIDPDSGNITIKGCSAGCIYSTLVSVCDSSQFPPRLCATTVVVIRVDSSPFPMFNRIGSVQEHAANNSQVAQFPAKENTRTSLHCSPVYPDSTIAPTSETTETENIARPVVWPEVQRHTSKGNQLVFYCDFYPLSDVSTMYQVTWYKDRFVTESILMSSTWISYNSREQFRSLTYMSEANIALGMSILCSIYATKLNITIPSEPYFAGFEITSKNPLQLQYTEEELVYIRLTVPFGCQRQHEECFLGVNMFYMETGADNCLLPVAAALSNCGVRISSWRWNQSYALRLALKHGQNLNNISRIYNIRFKTDEQFDHDFFHNYTLPRDIQVVATSDTSSLNGKECHAICDPHMQTFDGRYYENQNKGTYILYKHLKIPVQVQMKTNPCYGFNEGPPFCPCGVAIAAGRDVFIVDRCSIPIIIYMPQCDEGILHGKIKSDGNLYQIYLPSGAWLKITSGISFNVYIYPSMSDHMATSGLCGFLDSEVENDFMLRNGTTVPEHKFEDFNSNWLVQPEEDLFNTSNYFSLPRWPREDLYCICKEYQNGRVFQSDNCSPDSRKFCPESAPNDSLAADCNRKLSTHVNASIQLDPSDFNVSKIRNDTTMSKENFTEDSANYKCWSYLNSSLLFKKCSEVPDLVPETFANTCTKDALVRYSCTKDTLIAQTMYWAPTHLDNAQRKCIYQVTVNQPLPAHILEKYNVTLNPGEQASNNLTNKTGVYTSDFLKEVKNMACLMNCTDQGDCIKGQCLCYNGYGGHDCSVDLSKPPDVFGIPNIGVCDLHKTKCDQVSILGDNFVDSPSLSCRLSLFQVKRNQTKIHDKLIYMIMKAKWISFAEISCPIVGIRSKRSVELPDDPDTLATVYSVAVGNNREIIGRNISLLIIDSLCVDCIKAGFDIACTLKDGFDLINERCVKRTSAEKEPDSGSTVLIVSTALGSTLAVIVVGVILYYCLVLRRQRAKYEKERREAAYAQLQEMENRKENYSNIEEIYDEITDLHDDYLTPQDITHAVDESEDGKGSYEKVSNANTNMSEGYSYLNTLITNECESNARKPEKTEQIASTEETNMHSCPDDDRSNTDEVVRL